MSQPNDPQPPYGSPDYVDWYRRNVDPNWQPGSMPQAPLPQATKKRHPARWTIGGVVGALVVGGIAAGAATSGGSSHGAAASTSTATRVTSKHDTPRPPATSAPKVTHKAPATHAPTPTHTQPPVTHAAKRAPAPSAVVREYFAAINRRDYATAWRTVSPAIGGTYAGFTSGLNGSDHDVVTIDQVAGNVVTASLVAYQTDGSHKRYHGTYTVSGSRIVATHVTELAPPAPAVTTAEQNAIEAAHEYLSLQGFSRAGLIQQLSSQYADGYTLADATFAVDHITVDWNTEAVRSAKEYLSIQAFSRAGLIEQLTSSSGDQYTLAQATYAADHVGL